MQCAATTPGDNHAEDKSVGLQYIGQAMTMGSKDDEQAGLFVTYKDVPRSAGHPFYGALANAALRTLVRRDDGQTYQD